MNFANVVHVKKKKGSVLRDSMDDDESTKKTPYQRLDNASSFDSGDVVEPQALEHLRNGDATVSSPSSTMAATPNNTPSTGTSQEQVHSRSQGYSAYHRFYANMSNSLAQV